MKIIYNQNPLRTVVELDEHEKKELWYKIKIEQLEWKLHGARFCLNTELGYYNVDRAREEVTFDEDDIDTYVTELHTEYLQSIVDIHCGDCTCVPASCTKCHAESLFGIDTIKGLGKHEVSKIWSAFDIQPGGVDGRTLDQAIEVLTNRKEYQPGSPPPWEGAEVHYDRWNREAANALSWLKAYKDQHFKC